jgi:hypothetical protein
MRRSISMFRIWAIVVFLAGALVAVAQTPKKHRDYVPDEKTAVKIAEAVLTASFGEERVKSQLPLRCRNGGRDVWIVVGTEPGPPHKGGGMAVMINKHSGCIISILEHMK